MRHHRAAVPFVPVAAVVHARPPRPVNEDRRQASPQATNRCRRGELAIDPSRSSVTPDGYGVTTPDWHWLRYPQLIGPDYQVKHWIKHASAGKSGAPHFDGNTKVHANTVWMSRRKLPHRESAEAAIGLRVDRKLHPSSIAQRARYTANWSGESHQASSLPAG